MFAVLSCHSCGTQDSKRWHAVIGYGVNDVWCESCHNNCPGHVAHKVTPKVCTHCGTTVDDERPE